MSVKYCEVHQVTYSNDSCPACYLVTDRQSLIDRALEAECQCGRLRRALETIEQYAQKRAPDHIGAVQLCLDMRAIAGKALSGDREWNLRS